MDVAHPEFKEGDEVEVKSIVFKIFLSKMWCSRQKKVKTRRDMEYDFQTISCEFEVFAVINVIN